MNAERENVRENSILHIIFVFFIECKYDGDGKRKLKQRSEFSIQCNQLKLHQTKDDDVEKIVRKFYESRTQSVIDRIKLIEDQWRTLDLWEILQSVNPCSIMKFEEILKSDGTLSKISTDDMTFRRSSALCGIFENLMKTYGWKVGDSLEVEDDICNVVGQLMMKVDAKDMPDMIKGFQSAMMNIQPHGKERDADELRPLLITQKEYTGSMMKVAGQVRSSLMGCIRGATINTQAHNSKRENRSLPLTKRKYNGLKIACILLEQMIIDNKDNNVSWMRIVCSQFIDLVCQLIIEPDYREDVRWILNYYLLKLESKWTIWNIYNLMKNGILMYQGREEIFHQNLVRIRNLAIHPSMKVCLSNNEAPVSFEEILYCRDKNKWTFLEPNVKLHEDEEKSLELVLRELEKDEVGREEQESIKKLLKNQNKNWEKTKICTNRKLNKNSNSLRIGHKQFGNNTMINTSKTLIAN